MPILKCKMSGFLIDVPQLAYKTWNIMIVMIVDQNTGDRMIDAERELKSDLRQYEYSNEHEHVR